MSVVGLIGIGLSLAGTVIGASAQAKMIAEQTQASKKAENSREQQMQLDASHRRRQAVREAIVSRAMGLTVGTAQGAGQGSGVAGAMGNAVSQGGENAQMATSAEIIGGRIFQANRDYFDATQKGQAGMAMGQGLQSLGGMLVNNAGAINQIGQTYFGGGGSGLKRNI